MTVSTAILTQNRDSGVSESRMKGMKVSRMVMTCPAAHGADQCEKDDEHPEENG